MTVTELGGRVLTEVQDGAGFGRWAECQDDQGTRFGLGSFPCLNRTVPLLQ